MSDRPAAAVTERWLHEAVDRLREELVLFARTFHAFLLRPARAARAWASGETTYMNPLAFGAMAAGFYWAISNALALVWSVPANEAPDTIATELSSAVGPYLHYGLLGIVMHVALRVLGSRRGLLSSIGIAFFAGGSVGTLGSLLTSGAARWFAAARGTNSLQLQAGDLLPLFIFLAATIFYALICVTMARALKALHYTPGWKILLAATFAVVVTALLFGNVLPDGNYGWRPYMKFEPAEGLGLSFGFEG